MRAVGENATEGFYAKWTSVPATFFSRLKRVSRCFQPTKDMSRMRAYVLPRRDTSPVSLVGVYVLSIRRGPMCHFKLLRKNESPK